MPTDIYLDGDKPPECNSKTTDGCPPDPLLGGAIGYVRDLRARPGASPAALATAALQVEAFLTDVIKTKAATLTVDSTALSGLRLPDAIRYLRDLLAGPGLDNAARTAAAIQVEQYLVSALKAEAARLLAELRPTP